MDKDLATTPCVVTFSPSLNPPVGWWEANCAFVCTEGRQLQKSVERRDFPQTPSLCPGGRLLPLGVVRGLGLGKDLAPSPPCVPRSAQLLCVSLVSEPTRGVYAGGEAGPGCGMFPAQVDSGSAALPPADGAQRRRPAGLQGDAQGRRFLGNRQLFLKALPLATIAGLSAHERR